MEKEIFVTKPFLPPLEEFIPYLQDIWDRKWLTNNGYYHGEFEEALCSHLGVKHVCLFSNGTLALMSALQALRITGEVITTPFSFVATTHALWWNEIKPVFVDIEPNYYTLSPDKIEAAITPKTTAILPVHVYGNPCDVESIREIADTHGLKVIYDACHAFGVMLNGTSILNFGDLSVLSFHATKVFNTFEGGAIICHTEALKKRIDYLKNFGFSGETSIVGPGINAKLNEFQAALGLLQLKYTGVVRDRRHDIVRRYRANLNGIDGIAFFEDIENVHHNYAYFPITVNTARFGRSRDDLYTSLKERGIFCRRYFSPLISNFPFYHSLPSADVSNLPVANRIAEEILCLPIYPDLELQTVDAVCEMIRTNRGRAS